MFNEIMDFIERRWRSQDSNWMSGNCYWFARILCDRFPYLEIYYLPVIGHFIAGDKSSHKFYDWTGEVAPDERPVRLEDILVEDALWYDRLMKNCRD